jgi:hypothetical protein
MKLKDIKKGMRVRLRATTFAIPPGTPGKVVEIRKSTETLYPIGVKFGKTLLYCKLEELEDFYKRE